MININSLSQTSTSEMLQEQNNLSKTDDNLFAKQLKSAINNVNSRQVDSENAIADIATGQVKDLHQAALSINKAETSMKLMLEIRNKALNAYKELGRTQL